MVDVRRQFGARFFQHSNIFHVVNDIVSLVQFFDVTDGIAQLALQFVTVQKRFVQCKQFLGMHFAVSLNFSGLCSCSFWFRWHFVYEIIIQHTLSTYDLNILWFCLFYFVCQFFFQQHNTGDNDSVLSVLFFFVFSWSSCCWPTWSNGIFRCCVLTGWTLGTKWYDFLYCDRSLSSSKRMQSTKCQMQKSERTLTRTLAHNYQVQKNWSDIFHFMLENCVFFFSLSLSLILSTRTVQILPIFFQLSAFQPLNVAGNRVSILYWLMTIRFVLDLEQCNNSLRENSHSSFSKRNAKRRKWIGAISPKWMARARMPSAPFVSVFLCECLHSAE